MSLVINTSEMQCKSFLFDYLFVLILLSHSVSDLKRLFRGNAQGNKQLKVIEQKDSSKMTKVLDSYVIKHYLLYKGFMAGNRSTILQTWCIGVYLVNLVYSL